MRDGVRYQFYECSDGRHILFMASEQEFWRNFCEGVDRMDLFEKWPGNKYGDHAKGNRELQAELKEIFLTRTALDWIMWSDEVNTTIAAVNTPKTIAEDPQFEDRFEWLPASEHGADMLPPPIKFIGEELPPPSKAPTVGEHTDQTLARVLGYDEAKLSELRDAGALGD